MSDLTALAFMISLSLNATWLIWWITEKMYEADLRRHGIEP